MPEIECYRGKPQVFIIESLPAEDVNNMRMDGKVLERQLKLTGQEPIYRVALNLGDLRKSVEEFSQTNYRFLHISCHGKSTGVILAANPNGESFKEFSSCFAGFVGSARITFSACKLGNKAFYEEFYKQNKGVHSLIAPVSDLPFQRGSIFWAAYYTKLFEECNERNNHIKRDFIERSVPSLARVCGVSMKYAIYEPDKKRVKIKSTKKGRPVFICPTW